MRLAELLGIPVVQHRSYYADFPTSHPLHVGEFGTGMRFPEKFDLLINLGARAPVRVPAGTKQIHASIEPLTIGRNTPLTVALLGDLGQVARDLTEAIKSLAPADKLRAVGQQRLGLAKAYTTKAREMRVALARRSAGNPVPWQRMVVELNDRLDKDAVIVEEVGTEGKVLNFFDFADDAKIKIGRTEGRSLGWGTGAAAGVQLALPNRQVVNFQGDGGFLFGQTDALWTHSRYDLPIMTVIFNNRSYEEVRWNIMGAGGASGKAGRDYVGYLGDPGRGLHEAGRRLTTSTARSSRTPTSSGRPSTAGSRPSAADVHSCSTCGCKTPAQEPSSRGIRSFRWQSHEGEPYETARGCGTRCVRAVCPGADIRRRVATGGNSSGAAGRPEPHTSRPATARRSSPAGAPDVMTCVARSSCGKRLRHGKRSCSTWVPGARRLRSTKSIRS